MRLAVIVILTAALLVAAAACGGSKEEAKSVARQFWTALQDKNIEKARTYATVESAGSLNVQDNAKDQEVAVEFGEVESEDNTMKVATTLHTFSAGSETTVELQTVLLKEGGKWRVDVNRTMMSMFGGAMEDMMDTMTDAMEDAMESMAEEMQKSVEEMSGSMQQNP